MAKTELTLEPASGDTLEIAESIDSIVLQTARGEWDERQAVNLLFSYAKYDESPAVRFAAINAIVEILDPACRAVKARPC